MMKHIKFGLNFLVALIVVVVYRLLGLPVRAQMPVFQVNRRSARRAGAEGAVNLRAVRSWHAISTSGTISSYINTIFEDAIFVARDQNLMTQLVTVYNAQGLATRTLPIYPQATAEEVAEGVDYSNALTWNKSTQMTITPKIAKTQSILTAARIATDPDDARRDVGIEMGGAIAQKIDEDLLGLFTGFSTGKGTANSALTLANVAAAVNVLRNNKARGTVNVVLHPYGWHDIWVALGNPSANQAFLGETANQALRENYVQRMLGADWYISANIDVDANDDAVGAAFTREALAFDSRQAPIMLEDFDASVAGGGAYELNMEVWYGVGERRDTFGVKITHDATEPT